MDQHCLTAPFWQRQLARVLFVLAFFSIFSVWGPSPQVSADIFTCASEQGKRIEVEARLIGEAGGILALEPADGKILLMRRESIYKRVPSEGPDPMPADQVAKQLEEEFGADRFRYSYEKPFLVGIVLETPLPESRLTTRRLESALKKANKFMHNVEKGFTQYAEKANLTLNDPRHTLVLLIFESDAQFEEHARKSTGGEGLSAGVISGFYYGVTNYLYIRMNECLTFEVPLHEAIHQQVYNRGVFKRLGPIPVWFNEGIATGFEGRNGKISAGPFKLNSKYVYRAQRANSFHWNEVIGQDRAFQKDLSAGTAYTHAWSMHWYLLTKHRDGYTKYIKELGSLDALVELDEETRKKQFEEAFGKNGAEMQSRFPQAVRTAVKRQRIKPPKQQQPGYSETDGHLGTVSLRANIAQNQMIVDGYLRNVSPLRDMAFYVAVITGGGTYAEWYFPNVGMQKKVRMNQQAAAKPLAGFPTGPSTSYRVFIRSAALDSETAERWSQGDFPSIIPKEQ